MYESVGSENVLKLLAELDVGSRGPKWGGDAAARATAFEALFERLNSLLRGQTLLVIKGESHEASVQVLSAPRREGARFGLSLNDFTGIIHVSMQQGHSAAVELEEALPVVWDSAAQGWFGRILGRDAATGRLIRLSAEETIVAWIFARLPHHDLPEGVRFFTVTS